MPSAGFTSLFELKSRLMPEAQLDVTTWDDALTALGKAVQGRFDRAANRIFERAVDAADEFSARNLCVSLRRYPVQQLAGVELVNSEGDVVQAISLSNVALDKASGLLEFPLPAGGAALKIRVTYTGGYWLDDGPPPDGAEALPHDIREAWIAEVQLQAESRGLLGSAALRPSTSAKETPLPATGLSESAIAILAPYRRFSGP